MAEPRDLGQQVWVHRLTYGRFGLHTHGWLRIAWAGGFAWLGRLQFNLQHLPRVASGCCPPTSRGAAPTTTARGRGALTPASVDASFAGRCRTSPSTFRDVPTSEFWCHSWLLAPELADALRDPTSPRSSGAGRWTIGVDDGDADALFFTFARRPPVDLGELPRDDEPGASGAGSAGRR